MVNKLKCQQYATVHYTCSVLFVSKPTIVMVPFETVLKEMNFNGQNTEPAWLKLYSLKRMCIFLGVCQLVFVVEIDIQPIRDHSLLKKVL